MDEGYDFQVSLQYTEGHDTTHAISFRDNTFSFFTGGKPPSEPLLHVLPDLVSLPSSSVLTVPDLKSLLDARVVELIETAAVVFYANGSLTERGTNVTSNFFYYMGVSGVTFFCSWC